MTNQPIIDLLTSRAGSITYPGDEKNKPFPFVPSWYRTDGLNPELAEATMTLAKLHMAAIVHCIETDGASTIVSNAELADLRAAAAANEHLRHRQVPIFCRCGSRMVNSVNITDFNTDHPVVDGKQLIRALSRMSDDCAIGHSVMA